MNKCIRERWWDIYDLRSVCVCTKQLYILYDLNEYIVPINLAVPGMEMYIWGDLEGYAETSRNVQRKDSHKCSRKVPRKVLFAVPLESRGMHADYCRARCKNSLKTLDNYFWNRQTFVQKYSKWMLGRFKRALGTTYGSSLKTHFNSLPNPPHIDKYDTKSIKHMFLERSRGPNQAQRTQPSLRRIPFTPKGCEK